MSCSALAEMAMLFAICQGIARNFVEDDALSYFAPGTPLIEQETWRDFVSVLQEFDASRRTMVYLTGGSSFDSNGRAASESLNQAAPGLVVAEDTLGQVTVRVLSNTDGSREQDAARYAAWLARAIHLATTELWPAEAVPVIADVYLMDADTPYSLVRRVNWRDGQPLRVVTFRRNLTMHDSDPVAVHELYHLLGARWSLGYRGPDGSAAPNRSFAFDEIAAHLYARCTALLVDGALSRPSANFTVNLNGRGIQYPPVLRPDLRFMLDMLTQADAFPQDGLRAAAQMGAALRNVPIFEIVGELPEISLDSDPGQELIALCRDVSGDPARLDSWFESILSGPD
jgi:hypothetical protein